MGGIVLGHPYIHLASTGSTMDEVLELARAGVPEGAVVAADFQTDGKGRAGRSWVAAAGDALMMSILLRPQRAASELSPLSLLTGLAIVEALRNEYLLDATIKWPNDIQIQGRKVCGVLLRTHALPGNPHPVVVVGLGINTNAPASNLPDTATSIALELGHGVDPDRLRVQILGGLGEVYQRFLDRDYQPAWDRVQELLSFQEDLVRVQDGDRVQVGKIAGLGARGELLLHGEDGTIMTILAGDLTRGPRPIDEASGH